MKTQILNVEIDIDSTSTLRILVINTFQQEDEIVICRSNIFVESVSQSAITIFSNNRNLEGRTWLRHNLGHIDFGFKYALMTSFIGSVIRSADYRVITKVTREPLTLYTGITY